MAERLFTFGVYPAEVVRAIEAGEIGKDVSHHYAEEVDVRASGRVEAERLTQAEADELYGEGSRLFPLQPGGSGGLVWTWTVDLHPEAGPLDPSEPVPGADRGRFIPEHEGEG
jgi:hypothetical protein